MFPFEQHSGPLLEKVSEQWSRRHLERILTGERRRKRRSFAFIMGRLKCAVILSIQKHG